MENTIEVKIPFEGFYETVAMGSLERELEAMFSNEDGEPHYSLVEEASDACDWPKVCKSYAEGYAEAWMRECNVEAKFAELVSPRFYNYSTDEIYCTFSKSELARIFNCVDKKTLSALVAERLKRRPGFIPFYSDDLADWGELESWETPQLAILLEAYTSEYLSDDDYLYLMDSFAGNGHFTLWIEAAIPDETLTKLYDERDKLNEETA